MLEPCLAGTFSLPRLPKIRIGNKRCKIPSSLLRSCRCASRHVYMTTQNMVKAGMLACRSGAQETLQWHRDDARRLAVAPCVRACAEGSNNAVKLCLNIDVH